LEEVKGQTVGTVIIGEETDMTAFNSAVESFKANKPYEMELKVYKKDVHPFGYLSPTAR